MTFILRHPWKTKFRGKLKERVTPVPPEIGVPIAEKLSYVQDEKLSDLYVKLLAAASDSQTLYLAHPSFVNIINNLSPDEAQLLEYFILSPNLPLSYGMATKMADGSHRILTGPIVDESVLSMLHFPANLDAYLSNLDGLGLIRIKTDEWLTDDEHYAPNEEKNRKPLEELVAKDPELSGRTFSFKRGLAQRTSLGLAFIHACHCR